MKPNAFKQALRSNQAQIGLWAGTADPYVTEILAGTGFDWLVIDAEHAPNDLRTILGQLQAMAPYPTAPVVRTPSADPAGLKQLLDIGAQNLLIPMVDTAEQARALAAATRYPPQGTRGVGTALARAARWKLIPDYLQRANDEICLMVQVESVRALENLEAITAVDGVDGVFFGPTDLGASMGHIHDPGNPAIRQAVEDGMRTVLSMGKAAGVLTTSQAFAQSCLALGAQFVAVGLDTLLIIDAAKALLEKYRPAKP
ncbi:aldolase/citrate lyase family protein [Castellaniella sp.]|uniref:aldolase/citrate lyase family protein n=1 Tax=Castellaniella sp. TaxID=1955812 RepID=UPI003560EC87